MAGSKPLIFLEPLSETLEKLKEVFEANGDAEGVEVYEIDDLQEAAQLIPSIGQSLILSASPKKCAMMLQQNRKFIKNVQTKTILLSPKAIPRKTLDKFMKVGLTECVIEPVNPKTLLYKVRLQLRSIKSSDDDEDESEMNQKFGDNAAKGKEEASKKVRSKKGEEESEDEEVSTKKKTKEETLENYSKKTKKSYEEESIDNYYKGKQKKRTGEEEEGEETEENKGYKEEAIEGHYKGKLAKSMDIEVDEEEKKKQAAEGDEEEEEAIHKKASLEIDEDPTARKKKEAEGYVEEEVIKQKRSSLDIEEDSEGDIEDDRVEDLGGHYKGKTKKKLDIEEEVEYKDRAEEEEEDAPAQRKKKARLDIEDGEGEILEKREAQEEENERKERKKKLEIAQDPEEEELRQRGLNIEEDEGPSIEREEEYEPEQERSKKAKLDISDDDDGDEKEKKKVDDIDGYLRGGEAKKMKVEADLEDLYKRDNDGDEEGESEGTRKKHSKLSIDDDEDSLRKEEEEDKVLDDIYGRKKLKIVGDDDQERKKSNRDEESNEEKKLAKNSLDVEDDLLKRKSGAQKEEKEKGSNRSNARADRIKTHYSSKESLKHGEDDWDSQWDKKKQREDEFKAKKADDEFDSLPKEDLGEQTIDYAQLKKEFAAGSYDGVKNKKKVYGEFHEVAEVKTYTKTILGVTGTPEKMDFEEISKEQKEGIEGTKVFLPKSIGIEIAIEVQGQYLEEEIDSYKVCEFVQTRVSAEFSGDVIVYQSGKSGDLVQFYNGRIAKQIGRAPIKLTEEDLEGLSRSEKRERESAYEEDLKIFDLKKREVEGAFNLSWGTKLEQWKTYKTPKFRDHTFQELQNEFIFPFYEGASLLGIAVFIPTTKFAEERAESLEVVFEVLRGLLLTEYHKERVAQTTNNSAGSSKPKESKKSKEKKSGGFFGRFFGKKAG